MKITKNPRRNLLLTVASPLTARAQNEPADAPAIVRTSLIHGLAGPFAVAGYRIGEYARQRLQLTRGSLDLDVTHHSPAQVQWACVIDGLQAATGASLGKMNLHRVSSVQTFSVWKNRRTGQMLRFELASALLKANVDLPYNKLYAAGLRVAQMKESVFRVR
jgi:formylmethanofuran dehydrogenase subunit E